MLTADQRRRYARTIQLPEIGTAGQERLLASRICVVGCGALGSIAAMYLAASGAGHITLIDFDNIDISNLQRQLSFTTASLGQKKAPATATRLREINPDIEVTPLELLLTRHNAPDILAGHDLIIEGSDNPATKHLVAYTCTELRIPYIVGGIAQWEGQVLTCLPGTTGYLDLFPEPADSDGFTPCSIGGVLGPLPGIVASIQATEAIKLITGAGQTLSSRLLLIDALTASFRTVEL